MQQISVDMKTPNHKPVDFAIRVPLSALVGTYKTAAIIVRGFFNDAFLMQSG